MIGGCGKNSNTWIEGVVEKVTRGMWISLGGNAWRVDVA